jgi:Rrf2 family protein
MKNIIRISDAASIALHAAACMASNEGVALPVSEMAKKLNVSKNHLAKVLQRLSTAGIAVSSQGPKGGYSLKSPASEISFLDVFEAIDGCMDCSGCLLEKPCGKSKCIMGNFMNEMARQAKDFFKTKNLSEFAEWYKF